MADNPSLALACDPPKDRPPPALEPSKRKWHPSTWRYRIEEGQPELGSKPRRDSHFFSSSSIQREREREKEKAISLEPPKRSGSVDKEEAARDPIAFTTPNRQSWERLGILKKQGHNRDSERGKRNGIEQSAERMKKRKKKEAARTQPVENEVELCCRDEGFDRRKREMTPSELYFCEICSGRTERSVDGSSTGTSNA